MDDSNFYRNLIKDAKRQKADLMKMLKESVSLEEKNVIKNLIFSCDEEIAIYLDKIEEKRKRIENKTRRKLSR